MNVSTKAVCLRITDKLAGCLHLTLKQLLNLLPQHVLVLILINSLSLSPAGMISVGQTWQLGKELQDYSCTLNWIYSK